MSKIRKLYYFTLLLSFFSFSFPLNAEELTFEELKSITQECNEEAILQLKNDRSNESAEIAFLKNFYFLTCRLEANPKESLSYIDSVDSSFDKVIASKTTTAQVKKDISNTYAFTWFYPYFENNLFNEAKQKYSYFRERFQRLIERGYIDDLTLLGGEYFFNVGILQEAQEGDFALNGFRLIENKILNIVAKYDKKTKTLFADLLLDVRLRIIQILLIKNDLTALTGELIQFNKIYLSNINKEFINYKEFPNSSIKLNLPHPERMSGIAQGLTRYMNLGKTFPGRDELVLNFAKYNIMVFEFSGEAFSNLNMLVGSATILLPKESVLDEFSKQKICELIYDPENFTSFYARRLPTKIEDYDRNFKLLTLKAGCNLTSKVWGEYHLNLRRFFKKYKREIERSKIDIFTKDDKGQFLLYSVLQNIYVTLLQISFSLLLEDFEKNEDQIITSLDLIEKLVTMTGTKLNIRDPVSMGYTSNLTLLLTLLEHKGIHFPNLGTRFMFSENVFDELENLSKIELMGFALNYNQYLYSYSNSFLFDVNNPRGILSKDKQEIENIDSDKWKNEYKTFLEFHTEKSRYLIDLIIETVKNNQPLAEQEIEKNYQQTIRNMVSIYTFMQTTLNTGPFADYIDSLKLFQSWLEEIHQPFAEEIAQYTFLLQNNDVSLSLFRKNLLGELNSNEINLASDYFNIQKKLKSISDLRIISKNDTDNQALYLKEHQIRDDLAKLRGEMKTNFSPKTYEKFSKFYEYHPKSIRFMLKDNEMLIHYFNADSLYSPMVMVIYTNKNILAFPLKNIDAGVELLARRYVNNYLDNFTIQSANKDQFDKELSSSLYEFLFGGLEAFNFLDLNKESKSPQKIYIVTDGIMRNLPFQALYDMDEDKWMIEKYDIQYLPDIQSFFLLKASKINYEDQLFIGIGNPSLKGIDLRTKFKELIGTRGVADTKKILQLAPLPETEEELIAISKYFRKQALFTKDRANESEIRNSSIRDASIIAFATHAVENITSDSYEVGLVLTPPNNANDKFNDGFLTRGEISSLELNNPIVILSACNTSRGLYSGAEIFSGLPAGFFEAGASSVISSMWDLESGSAKEMSSLAMEIATRDNMPIGSAYNQAMREFIRNPKYEQYSHPFYWAGFQTIGK